MNIQNFKYKNFLISFLLIITSCTASAGIVDGKYGVAQVFDVQRSPAYPVADQNFTASSMKAPYETASTTAQYTMTNTQYIQFVINDAGTCADISIKLFEANGTENRVIANGGKIHGLADEGFLYVSDNSYGTFVSNKEGFSHGDSVTYKAKTAIANCTDLSSFKATTKILADGETAASSVSITSTNPKTTVKVNEKYSYKPTATDAQNDLLTWSQTAMPSWITFQGGKTQSTFAGTGATPTQDNNGTYDSADGTKAAEAKISLGSLLAKDGKVFFGDFEEYGIRYIEDGKIKTKLAGDGNWTTLQAKGLSYDSQNDILYYGDYASDKFYKLDANGNKTEIANNLTRFVQSSLLDKENNKLYVGTRSAIYKIDLADSNTSTNTTRIVGDGASQGAYSNTGTASTSKVKEVTSMVFDKDKNLIIADRGNYIIRKINIANDTIETIAGIAETRNLTGDDANATSAGFDDPSSIVIDHAGKIFITERVQKKIRVINTDGKIKNFANITSSGFLEHLSISDDGTLYIGLSSQIIQLTTNPSLEGTPTASDIGEHNVSIRAEDGNGDSAIQSFKITVSNTSSSGGGTAGTIEVKSGTSTDTTGTDATDGAYEQKQITTTGSETITAKQFTDNKSSKKAEVSVKNSSGQTRATVTSKIDASITISDDGTSTTTASTTNKNGISVAIEITAKTTGDTRASHKVTKENIATTVSSNIDGSETIIDTDGSVETKASPNIYTDPKGCTIVANALTDTDGETSTTYTRICDGVQTTLDATIVNDGKFESGNSVDIYEENGDMYMKVNATVTREIQF